MFIIIIVITRSVIKIGRGHWGEVAGAADLAGDVAGDGDGREAMGQQRARVAVVHRRFAAFKSNKIKKYKALIER